MDIPNWIIYLSPEQRMVVIGSFLLFPRIILKQSPFNMFQIRSYGEAEIWKQKVRIRQDEETKRIFFAPIP